MFETKLIIIVEEFTNDEVVYGTYIVEGLSSGSHEKKIFIRNGDSIGVVVHYRGDIASNCVSEIRDDVKEDFLKKLSIIKGENKNVIQKYNM